MKIKGNESYYPITIRAEIASRCLQGLLSTEYWASLPAKELAIIAIERADALIQELNESEKAQ